MEVSDGAQMNHKEESRKRVGYSSTMDVPIVRVVEMGPQWMATATGGVTQRGLKVTAGSGRKECQARQTCVLEWELAGPRVLEGHCFYPSLR